MEGRRERELSGGELCVEGEDSVSVVWRIKPKGLVCVRQVLYQLSHIPVLNSEFSVYFI